MLFIADKYKEKGLTLDELFHHYDRLIVKKNINFERQSHFLNEELSLKNYSNNRGTKIEVIQETNTWNQPDCPKDLQIQRENLNEIKTKNVYTNNNIEIKCELSLSGVNSNSDYKYSTIIN